MQFLAKTHPTPTPPLHQAHFLLLPFTPAVHRIKKPFDIGFIYVEFQDWQGKYLILYNFVDGRRHRASKNTIIFHFVTLQYVSLFKFDSIYHFAKQI